MAISKCEYSEDFWMDQHALYEQHRKRAVKINWFERYFNRETGGYKEYQFLNALDIRLWELGYKIVSVSSWDRARKWTKDDKKMWVSGFGYGYDNSCPYNIPMDVNTIPL